MNIYVYVYAAAAKSLQSCPTLCDPMDCSLPGSSVHGILQARTLEWVAISFSNAWKWKVKVKSLSRVRLLATPWTAAYQDTVVYTKLSSRIIMPIYIATIKFECILPQILTSNILLAITIIVILKQIN